MSEESWLSLSSSVEPSPRFDWLASQSFELLHRPSDEVFVDAHCDGRQLGAVAGPVVVEPAPDLGVDRPRETGEVRSTATVEVPVPDPFTDGLLRLGADSR
jgi:hypothetical protein